VLYIAGSSRNLITEAMRGEGARLIDRTGYRFMPDYDRRAELAPRDVVSSAIVSQMEKTRHPNVYLDLTHLDADAVRARFPGIAAICAKFDLDITKDLVPVRPGAHYMMGGLTVDATLGLGAGGLTKTGTGDLTLTSAQTFTGNLTINQGTLALSGTASVTSNTVRVASGGTLDISADGDNAYTLGSAQTLGGNGTVALGNTDLTVEGTLSPGLSPGSLTFTSTGGDLIMDPSGTLLIEITGTEEGEFDTLTLSDVDFVANGTLQFSSSLGVAEVGTTLQIFDVSGGSLSGGFTSVLGSFMDDITYWDTTNLLSNGTITAAIPEPASGLILILASLGVLRRARRRR
jgi:autotransporter-associated beta strand protein